MSVKTAIKYGVLHVKCKGICMKADCSLGSVCTALTLKAILVDQVF